MKVTDVAMQEVRFLTSERRDRGGRPHPGDEHEARAALLRISTEEGAEGFFIVDRTHGPDPAAIRAIAAPELLGEDPFDRERLWHRLRRQYRQSPGPLNENTIAALDQALWDLAGRALGQPVHELLGGYRDSVPAYASTAAGDDLEGGLNTPEAFADFALACKA